MVTQILELKNEFFKNFIKKNEIKITLKHNGREGVDFVIGENQLYLQSIDLDATQRSIKIAKQNLGELRYNLFIALVLIIDKEPKVFYLIPSIDLLQSGVIFL